MGCRARTATRGTPAGAGCEPRSAKQGRGFSPAGVFGAVVGPSAGYRVCFSARAGPIGRGGSSAPHPARAKSARPRPVWWCARPVDARVWRFVRPLPCAGLYPPAPEQGRRPGRHWWPRGGSPTGRNQVWKFARAPTGAPVKCRATGRGAIEGSVLTATGTGTGPGRLLAARWAVRKSPGRAPSPSGRERLAPRGSIRKPAGQTPPGPPAPAGKTRLR